MSKFDEAIVACKAQMSSCNIECDEILLKNVAKGLGPSIYNKDANLVAAGDPKELNNIKTRTLNITLRLLTCAWHLLYSMDSWNFEFIYSGFMHI